jgi:C4-dicarboxylate-specific signal transduction histidine kinase
MSTPPPTGAPTPGPTPDALWLVTLNELLLGANHALNNRLTALRALVRLVEEAYGRGRLEDALAAELGQLERIGELLRRLPGHAAAKPHALHLPDTVHDVVTLFRAHAAARDLDFHLGDDSRVPPVWAEESALVRALFVVLSRSTAWASRRPGAAVAVRYTGDEARVEVVVEAVASGEASAAPSTRDTDDAAAVQALAMAAGGELLGDPAVEGERPCYRLAFPSLACAPER